MDSQNALPFKIEKETLAEIIDEAQNELKRMIAVKFPSYCDLNLKRKYDHAVEFLATGIKASLPQTVATHEQLHAVARTVGRLVKEAGKIERDSRHMREVLSPSIYLQVKKLRQETFRIIWEEIHNAPPEELPAAAEKRNNPLYKPSVSYIPRPVSFAGMPSGISPTSGDAPLPGHSERERPIERETLRRNPQQPLLPDAYDSGTGFPVLPSFWTKPLPHMLDGKKFELYAHGVTEYLRQKIRACNEGAAYESDSVINGLYESLEGLLLSPNPAQKGENTPDSLQCRIF